MFHRKKPTPQNEFMEYVQLHERSWGDKTYPGRPNLTEIMQSRVVVFWQIEGKADRYVISLYKNIPELEKFLTRVLLLGNVNLSRRRLAKIFKDQQRLQVTGLRLLLQEPPNQIK